jgi:dihydroflavonol-4-reductase
MWLVTGATGHVGNVLVRKLLERGEKVRALLLPGECRESISGLNVEACEGGVVPLEAISKFCEEIAHTRCTNRNAVQVSDNTIAMTYKTKGD